jgi:hypothetical protein
MAALKQGAQSVPVGGFPGLRENLQHWRAFFRSRIRSGAEMGLTMLTLSPVNSNIEAVGMTKCHIVNRVTWSVNRAINFSENFC